MEFEIVAYTAQEMPSLVSNGDRGGRTMKITKQNGKMEEFDRANVERSIRNAGADEKTAKDIATIVAEKKCESTKEIRSVVNKELKKMNSNVAEKYRESRRLVVRNAVDAARGAARMSKDAMANLDLKAGDNFTAMNGNKRHTLRAERDDKTDIRWNDIRLHPDDMNTLNVSDGKNLVVRRTNA